MTRYIRAAQYYPINPYQVTQPASSEETNLRALHWRICQKVGTPYGTSHYGEVRTFSTNLYMVMEDTVYAALLAAGVDFSDCLYNDSVQPGSLSATSRAPNVRQNSRVRQLVMPYGDSLSEGQTGATANPELNLPQNQPWSFAAQTPGLDVVYNTSVTPWFAENSQYGAWNSRKVFKGAHGGWRLDNIRAASGAPVADYFYDSGSSWLLNFQETDKWVYKAVQQRLAWLQAISNVFAYSYTNGNQGLNCVPAGADSSYMYRGGANFIDHVLVPFVAALRASDPNIYIVLETPIARQGITSDLNDRFVEVSRYMVDNRVALGLDYVVDNRLIPELTPTNPSVVTNMTFYQPDGTHLMYAGYQLKLPQTYQTCDLALRSWYEQKAA